MTLATAVLLVLGATVAIQGGLVLASVIAVKLKRDSTF